MNNRRAFEIAFVGLKPGIHEYHYTIDDSFFEEYGGQDFKGVIAEVKLALDKKASFMILKFEVGGKVQVSCDRCGNDLPLDLWDEFDILVKMADDPEVMNDQESDPDVFYISRAASHLDVKGWIYEFISLSVPMQRMCAEKEIGGPFCNKEVLARLAGMDPTNKGDQPSKKSTNALWKGLDKFKKQ
jgi:uncharacterized metal-binding protein YceD (DUF177 family)